MAVNSYVLAKWCSNHRHGVVAFLVLLDEREFPSIAGYDTSP